MSEQITIDELNPKHTDQLHTPSVLESSNAASEATDTQTQPPVEEEPHISEYATTLLALTPDTPLVVRREFHFNYWLLVAALLLVILAGEHISPLITYIQTTYFHHQANVTIFTSEKTVHFEYKFLAVTGTPDTGQQQVPSRIIQYQSSSKSVLVKATGIAKTDPTPAYGSIIFYNDAPYTQTIDAGTVIESNDGIQIVTDEAVTIAAGTGATNGSGIVSAHTIQAGESANIPAYDIDKLCCISGIRAINTSGFSGGKDPASYTVVGKDDVTAAIEQAATFLDPLSKSAIIAQESAVERGLTAIRCSFTTQATPKVGEKATNTTVTVAESCMQQVYDNAVLENVTRSQFLHDVTKQIGVGYTPKREVTISLLKPILVDASHHTYTLAVSVNGSCVYRPTPSQLHRLTSLIAGKSILQARGILLTNTGIEGVYIQPIDNNQTLPTDPSQINITIS